MKLTPMIPRALAFGLCMAATAAIAQTGSGAPATPEQASPAPRVTAAASLNAASDRPGVLDNRWAVIPQIGIVFADSSDLDSGISGGLRLNRPLSDRIVLDLGFDYANLETANAGDYERLSARGGVLLHFGKPYYDRSSDFQPFIGAGVHLSNVKFLGASTGAYGPYASAGFLQRLSPGLSLVFEGRYQIDDVQDKGPLVEQTYYTWQALVGLRFALGSKPVDPDGDDDGDGVPNRLDQCPDTPPNTPVDARGCTLDSDGDGVPDHLDECPNTPRGVQVDRRGCPLDSDGDGVPDYLDKCPNTPRGVEVGPDGCPLIDSDGDGVPDYRDTCPDTPKGVQVGPDGCPLDSDGDGIPDYLDECPNTPPGLKVLPDGCALVGDCRRPRPGEEVDARGCAVDRSFVLRGVKFEFDSDRLTPDARRILDMVAETLLAYPNIDVELEGHTDNIGTPAYNLGLSERRAIAVKNYLMGRGVPGGRMVPVGYGLSQPIADNSSEDGREENRRVEMTPRN